jgi:hypothetical protein
LLFIDMALWTPGPWDQVADPATANALKVNALVNGEVPAEEETSVEGCPMPKPSKKTKAEPVEEVSQPAE